MTKKNHSRAFINKKTQRAVVLPSKAYTDYEKAAAPFLKPLHINTPVNIKALYYMPTRRRVDRTNLESALMDVLVHCGVLEDDSALSPAIAVSSDGSRVRYDKKSPRTEITIEDVTEDDQVDG